MSTSNQTVPCEKCCSIDFSQRHHKEICEEAAGSCSNLVVLHWKWITVRRGMLTRREGGRNDWEVLLNKCTVSFAVSLDKNWAFREVPAFVSSVFSLCLRGQSVFEVGAGFLSVCLQCNDALVWCCTARSDGVNQCTFEKAEISELVLFKSPNAASALFLLSDL